MGYKEKKFDKESEKTEIDQPTILETDFIYSSPNIPFIQYAPPRLIDWDDIEKALGFKLFYWQKTYLQGQGFRRCGKTVAMVLHDLLIGDTDSTSIDLTNLRPTDKYKIKMYKDFHDKLTSAGIPCRELKLPEQRM